MRPATLNPLFAETTALGGVGPAVARSIDRLAGPRIIDLLRHLPVGIVDRRRLPAIGLAADGAVATLLVTVDRHLPPDAPRRPYRIECSDESERLTLVYFHAAGPHLQRLLPDGSQRLVSGRIERFGDRRQIVHPDFVAPPDREAALAVVEAAYPLTEGLTGGRLRQAMTAALTRVTPLPEWLDPALVDREAWPSWDQALRRAHAPATPEDLAAGSPERRRLAYDELLASQLALALIRQHVRSRPGQPVPAGDRLRRAALAAFGHPLTGAQTRALAAIDADLASPERMLRMLQGDVGTGKTLVALLAMLSVVQAGGQAALMAPTEILARQHLATIQPLAAASGISAVGLTGRDRGRDRQSILDGLADGSHAIAVGTHALIQDEVRFRSLMLAVIDEQHRFGVQQRMALTDKGPGVNMLVMTATPIPRTLLMTLYGDLESSRLDERPPGRKPVQTRVVPMPRLDEVVAAVGRAVSGGGQVFWICPLVEADDAVPVTSAEERHAALSRTFGDRVALAHGRQAARDKEAAMTRFRTGDAAVLVATTVVEVGVDVPSASVIIIEHAERFGLAQLHQLRGRVGRGDTGGTCILLYGAPLGAVARERLSILRHSDDGFLIAEEDLRLRGSGDLLGTRQSGLPRLHFADLAVHGGLLEMARDDARLVLARDPGLESTRGAALRHLLYLFERDAAVRYLRSG